MSTILTCKASALAPFVHCLENAGVDVNRHLLACRIPPELVANDEARIAKTQTRKFFSSVEKAEGICDLGVLMGDPFTLNDLGSLGHSLNRAVTLKDAIETFGALVPDLAEGNEVSLRVEGETAMLVVRTTDLDVGCGPPDHYTLRILLEIIRLGAGQDWLPKELFFQSVPTTALDMVENFAEGRKTFLSYGSAIAFPKRCWADA